MKKCFLILLIVFCLNGCFSIIHEVSPEKLDQYKTCGSLNTLWYMGSDQKYHYFSHLCKTRTEFKVKKSDLLWEHEVPYGSLKEYILVHGSILDRISKNTDLKNILAIHDNCLNDKPKNEKESHE